MFDKERFKFALENYKKDFPTWFEGEKYKWEAVKCFQDNWDIKTSDFEGMLNRSICDPYKIAISTAWNVILEFAKISPNKIRDQFVKLFDETQNVFERIENFVCLFPKNLGNNKKKRNPLPNFQDEHSISTYLWLYLPDKYYPYRVNVAKNVSKILNSDYIFTWTISTENMRIYYKFCDEICNELKKDAELVSILQKNLTDKCYKDTKLKTLTTDFCFYINRNSEMFGEEQYKLFKEKTVFIPVYNFSSYQNQVELYTKENFLSEVYISEEKYNLLVNILDRKKNIILQGAPGVGKTFAAKRLAYSIIGEKNDSQIEFVQFHQNYSYEDFVIGWRPTENNFELRHGIFYNFCKKAAENPDEKFFFIIDEINRGNMSKIFGELLMLIEKDHRAEKIKLSANGEEFSVPENLFIIGMMNTADRSLAIIDYALRRRFSFFEMTPAFDSDGFKKYQSALNSEIFDRFIEKIKILNEKISANNSLGKGFCIGHSYFCGLESCDEKILRSIVDYEILPLLEEYFFDDENKFQEWKNILRGVFNE